MNGNSFKDIFEEANAKIRRALDTRLNIVVCGPGKSKTEESNDRYQLREVVRQSLKGDEVNFLEDLLQTEEGKQTARLLEETLNQPPTLDQLELLLLKGKTIEKDVHIVEGAGAIAELVEFVKDEDVFKKVYAFVDERYRNNGSFLEQSAYTRLLRAQKLFWFKDGPDLEAKVRGALNPNRILKSGIL
jgi:hypothetical protein